MANGSPPDNTTLYIVVATSIIICLTISAITLICIFRPGDNSQMITNIIGFATVAVTSLMALIKAMGTGKAISDLSEKTDGKLTKLIEATVTNPAAAAGTTTTTTTFEPQIEPPKSPVQ